MKNRLFRVNETGIGLRGDGHERIRSIRIFREGATIQLWFSIWPTNPHEAEKIDEFLQYLSPREALLLSRHLKALAVEAFIEDYEVENN